MFDTRAFANPDAFEPGRNWYHQFHFGYGAHECLGRGSNPGGGPSASNLSSGGPTGALSRSRLLRFYATEQTAL
jgi:hypothetical protein